MKTSEIVPAELDWNESGSPIAKTFGDIYFSKTDGLEESRYIFLQGNQLQERWEICTKPTFTIAEAGFGTGLNLLALWQLFHSFQAKNRTAPLKRIHYISFEKFPIALPDLVKAHSLWSELTFFAERLQAQWPKVFTSGCHRLHLDENITIDLWFGDIHSQFAQLSLSLENSVDCWFLDGFSPSQNPEMWNSTLFQFVAQLTAHNGSFATFSAAGSVRRGLQKAGFEVERIKGFAQKREMLRGHWPHSAHSNSKSAMQTISSSYHNNIAIVGGGIASACLALSFLRRGIKPVIYCADPNPAEGASSNQQGICYSPLNADNSLLSPFYTHCFLYARQIYHFLAQQGISFEHAWCGVIQLGYDLKNKQKIESLTELNFPKLLVHPISQASIEELSAVPIECDGLHYPLGGWLAPKMLTTHLFDYLQAQGVQCFFQHEMTHFTSTEQEVQLHFTNRDSIKHRAVILANGHRLNDFQQTQHLPIYSVRGQVSHIPTNLALRKLKKVLCYNGYLTPFSANYQTHVLGASHIRNDLSVSYSNSEQQQNRQRLVNALSQSEWPKLIDISSKNARCSIRAAIRDHYPLMGQLSNERAFQQHISNHPEGSHYGWPNVYLLGALGSRGLCTAPLLAETLVSSLLGEPLPLPQSIIDKLQPNRFLMKQARKQWHN